MLKTKVQEWFFEAVALEPADEDLKRALRAGTHPRVNVFITNLCAEFEKADKLLLGSGLSLNLKDMQQTTYDMTKVFMSTLELAAKRMYESDLTKRAREAQAAALAQADDFLSGGTDNEYSQELGLVNEEVKEITLKT